MSLIIKRLLLALISTFAFFLPCAAFAVDTYDGRYLKIPRVLVGTTVYKNVTITIKDVLSVSGGTPAISQDAYVLQTGKLLIPNVTAFGNSYTNVTATLGEVISIEGSESACITPSVSSNRYRIAEVDMRFDQLSDFTPERILVNSFENVSQMIDKIKCLGFDTVQLTTNIPIDIESGSIMLLDPDTSHPNRDKNPPKDIWRVASYAKTKGLKVFIAPAPVYYVNDTSLSPLFLKFGSNFSYSKFFQTLIDYGGELARKSQEVGADGFYIGIMNLEMDTEQYSAQWDRVVQNYRNIFSGKLIYHSCFQCSSPIWNKVDIVSLEFNPILIRTKNYDIKNILKAYEATQDDANHGGSINAISTIQKNYANYKKPIILSSAINSGDNAVGAIDNFWDLLNEGVPLSKFQPDYALQALRHAALFELVARNLSSEVFGFTMFQFMPWKDADWLINPPSGCRACINFNVNSIIASVMNRNEAIHQVFLDYFVKPWGTRLQ